jgi:hypothetical protein
MASPEQMPPVTFRPTRGQRRHRLVGGALTTAVGIAVLALALAGQGHGNPVKQAIGALLLVAIGIFVLGRPGAHTTIGADGIEAVKLFGRLSCRWSEVSDITVKVAGKEGPVISSIKIHREGGRAFSLPAPIDSTQRGSENPDFMLQLATIRSYWNQAWSAPSAEDARRG